MTTANKNYALYQGTSTLERPRYTAGLLLEDDDLTAAVNYTRNMTRLLFRSLFGCGVICGLDIKAQLTCGGTEVDVTVGKGVALDCLGNPIEIPKEIKVTFDGKCKPIDSDWLWVTVCYFEKCCRPKDISCAPDENGQLVQTRILDGFEVRVYARQPKCACSCEPPPKGTRSLRDCCDDEEEPEAEPAPAAPATPAAAAGGALLAGNAVEIPEGPGTGRVQVPKLPDLCDCYQKHYEGKCDCNCCCPCVLVGKIQTRKREDKKDVDLTSKDPQPLQIDRDFVRWIRPVLTGYYKCVKPKDETITTTANNVG